VDQEKTRKPMKGARNACGPLNGRDWRWGSN
jgi:hypothetical protein